MGTLSLENGGKVPTIIGMEGAIVRVARLYGTGDIRVGDEPEPAGTPSVPPHDDDEALVRVTAVGICGSDLHWWTEGAIGDA